MKGGGKPTIDEHPRSLLGGMWSQHHGPAAGPPGTAGSALQRSAMNQRGSFYSAKLGVTATQSLTCRPILSRHYAGMMQDGLRIAGTHWGGGKTLHFF